MLVMAVWSVSAMGHGTRQHSVGVRFARFFSRLGESGNFPAAIKTRRGMVSAKMNAHWLRASFNSGANIGAILAPAIVPWVTLRWGWHVAFSDDCIFSVLWILWWFRYYRKPADPATLTAWSCAISTRKRLSTSVLLFLGGDC